jgi:hypothetical protein
LFEPNIIDPAFDHLECGRRIPITGRD